MKKCVLCGEPATNYGTGVRVRRHAPQRWIKFRRRFFAPRTYFCPGHKPTNVAQAVELIKI